jgi:hypothetical protein
MQLFRHGQYQLKLAAPGQCSYLQKCHQCFAWPVDDVVGFEAGCFAARSTFTGFVSLATGGFGANSERYRGSAVIQRGQTFQSDCDVLPEIAD